MCHSVIVDCCETVTGAVHGSCWVSVLFCSELAFLLNTL